MRVVTLLAVFGVVLLGPPASGAEPGTVEREIRVGGATRSYLIHVPAAWDRVQPLPVLFVFHGAGSDAENMVQATGFDALADASPAAHMIVVYPRAPVRVKRYEVDPPAGRESADVLFVDALLERLRARFAVDARRIWATGFSNGAAFCYRLAAARPNVIAAIAPVAGYMPNLVRTPPAPPVPVLHVHGTADGRVGAPDGPTSAVRTWAGWNGAGEGPVEGLAFESGGLALRRQKFTGPTPRNDAHLLLVEGKGHEWSGGPGGTISRTILEFLAAHPLPAATGSLVGKPFGSLEALRWGASDGEPYSVAAQPLTLFSWWTPDSPDARAMQLTFLALKYREQGLRLVVVQTPGSPPLLSLSDRTAFDDRRAKFSELAARAGMGEAKDLTVLVDAKGLVRWVSSGTRTHPSVDLDFATLNTQIALLLPPAPAAPEKPR